MWPNYWNDSPAQRQDTGSTCCNIAGPDSSSDDDRGNRSQGELGLPAHVNHTSNSFWGFLRFTVRNSQICSEQRNEALQSIFPPPLACVQVCKSKIALKMKELCKELNWIWTWALNLSVTSQISLWAQLQNFYCEIIIPRKDWGLRRKVKFFGSSSQTQGLQNLFHHFHLWGLTARS